MALANIKYSSLKKLNICKYVNRSYATEKSEKVKVPIRLYGLEGRYATALYTASVKQNVLDKTVKDMERIKKDLSGENALTRFSKDPQMARIPKAKLIKEAAKLAEMAETTGRFLELLAENGRLKKLQGIILKFDEIMRAARGEVYAEVRVSSPLDEEQTKDLKKALNKFLACNEKLKLNVIVDPSLLGGMTVFIGDRYVDMSIANKIEFYKKILLTSL